MNAHQKVLAALSLAFFLLSHTAYAEIFQGEIKTLNAEANNFVMKLSGEKKSGKKKPQEINVQILPLSQLAGITSLQELRAGDEVTVNAMKNEKNGKWEAHSLLLEKVKIRS